MEKILKDKDKHGNMNNFLQFLFKKHVFLLTLYFVGLIARVKEGAEKIQAKAESALLVKQERESSSRKSEDAKI